MKLWELFERNGEAGAYDWHHQQAAKAQSATAAKNGKDWEVRDAKGTVIFHELDDITAKKAQNNPAFIKKYGKMTIGKMK